MTLKDMLIAHEGLALKPYRCPSGKLTIGVGRNLEDSGITEGEAIYLLEQDILKITKMAKHNFHWFDGLDPIRQDVVLNMIFNLGLGGFSQFKALHKAIELKDWELAQKEMMHSRWSKQVGMRAILLSRMMRSGEYPKE